MRRRHVWWAVTVFLASVGGCSDKPAAPPGTPEPAGPPIATASTTVADSAPGGPLDGDRFGVTPGTVWRGKPGEPSWWWQVEFPQPRDIGAILQVHGDHPLARRNAPKSYVWQASTDGTDWHDLDGSAVTDERRTFRLHRLAAPQRVRYLRLSVASADGDAPALRGVEFFADPKADVPFPPWAVVVNTTGDRTVPGTGSEFVPLARSCDGWDHLQAQNVWLGDFDEALLAAEPRPLCAFLSGNFKDWCQQDRGHWRGVQEVLRAGRLPMWAACGGAQGLAILAEVGVDRPWDCPHCRDPKAPRLPIYTHIGHTGPAGKCGTYDACVFERGPHNIRQVLADPVFAGLPREFKAPESHCGQIGWPPEGWVLVAAGGEGARTKTQCLRVKDRYVYAAQFHIEMAGTPEVSRAIMGNFLGLAKGWGGYNPAGKPGDPPGRP
ncbi:MAG: discoidin domain-containing protein [Gemmataceae bacterium]|nr:discoidin domain-containing protein [Gemmataceae bacterium]